MGCSRSTSTAYAAPLALAPSRVGAFCLERLRMRKLRPRFRLQNGTYFPDGASNGNCIPESTLGTGCAFPWGSQRKMYPGIRPRSGMHFPERSSTGNCVPESTLGTGYTFRNGLQAEIASRSEPSFRDTVSARHAIWKAHSVLSVRTGTRFPREWLLGKRGPDRGGMRPGNAWLNSPYSSTSLSHVGSAVCRIPAVCSFLASIPAERTSFMVKRSRG